MDDVQGELEWEQHMLEYGVARFRMQEDKAKERGDYTGTNGGARLLKGYLSQVSEYIAHYLAGNSPGGRRRSKYSPVLQAVDPDKLALITLTSIVSAVHGETEAVSAASTIGGRVEDELRFAEFELANKELFNQIQRDLDNRNSESYRHRHRVLNHAMRKANVEWRDWGNEMRSSVGLLLLSLTLDATDLVTREMVQEGKKRKIVLRAAPEVLEWIKESDEAVAAMMPDRMPMLIRPEDWTTYHTGGYLHPRLRQTTGLVKFRRGSSGRAQRDMLQDAQISRVMRAVNGMQSTPWRINKRVLAALQRVWHNNLGVGMPPSQPYEIPPAPIPAGVTELTDQMKEDLDEWKHVARELYAKEKLRKSLVLGVARTMRIGQMLKEHDDFYFVYQLDFRGRVYCTSSGISPQGADPAKGCLEFAEGKPLGERGAYWLKVHGANKFGYDKVSYDDRVAWVDDNREAILAAADNPTANRELWANADKPYQFLAFCFEYAGYAESGEAHVCHLPIALDGSCNGLQHFSAMLRDTEGARAVNLTPGLQPSDIYQDVADVCTRKLQERALEGDNPATNWLKFLKDQGYDKLPRKASKKPVMTLPYGSTQQACTSSLFSWYIDHDCEYFPKNTAFRHCIYLSKLLWDSIGEVVVAARQAMDWVQKMAGDVAKQEHPLVYRTPLGFPMYQASNKQQVKQVCHRVGGSRMRVSVAIPLDDLDSRKQRQGSAPNLVHSVDATHMMMCITAGMDIGISSFAMIHDDFGVHACHVDDWQHIIREQFVKLHSEHDILRDLWEQMTERTGLTIPEPPKQMDFDLSSVMDSPYFFG